MPKSILIDLSNRKFGRLAVLERAPNLKPKEPRWHCRCDCGELRTITGKNLRNGNSTSCGCFRKERTIETQRKRLTTHGQSKSLQSDSSPEWRTWMGMITRCRPQHDATGRYGKRGIRVCQRWLDAFENFLEDMGKRPPGIHGDGPAYSLGRIDNDGPYSPENCRWETWKQQQRNRSSNYLITAFGKTMTLQDWAEETNINKMTLRYRFVRGWKPEDALTRATEHIRYITAFGRTLSLQDWAEEKGLNQTTLWCRIQRGWEPERALSKPPMVIPNRRRVPR